MKGEVLVIGLGLIGGSLAMAIRQAHSDVHIVGYDVNTKNIQLAQLLGIIDKSVDSIEEAASEADLIVLAVPVDQTEKILVSLAEMELKEQVIVTDAGSTKSTVVEAAKPLLESEESLLLAVIRWLVHIKVELVRPNHFYLKMPIIC